jgi:hypothetical protein
MPKAWYALAALAAAAGAASVPAAGVPELASYGVAPDAQVCELPDGGIAVLEPPRGPLRLWDARGRPLRAIRLGRVPPGVAPGGIAASATHVVVTWWDADEQASLGWVVSLNRGRVVGRMGFPGPPLALAVGPRSVAVERPSLGEPASVEFFRLDGSGAGTRSLPAVDAEPPGGHVPPSPLVGMQRLVFVGAELWGVRADLYELWRLDGAPARVAVPEALRAGAFMLTGDAAVRRRRESGGSGGGGATVPLTMPAVRRVSRCGAEVAVLVEDRPGDDGSRCRVDVWAFPGPRVRLSQRLEGACPRGVYLENDGLWVLRGGSFAWRPFDASAR